MQSGKRPAINYILSYGFLVIQIAILGCTTINASDFNRQQRIEESPQWNGKTFQNPERVPEVEWGPSLKMFWNYFFDKSEGFIPDSPLPTVPFDISQWNEQRGLQFAWLGHTTFLIKIDDKVILTDPMFSQRAGSFGWVSPKRYSKTLASTDSLPLVDVVLITHNHPDHLDEDSIKALIPKTSNFIAPLAVGELLEKWGVPHKRIFELDWWQLKSIDGLTITAAPSKHTSERGIFDKNLTLWASYGIRGKNQNLYLSGDSGWFNGLFEIGERLGPFDVTFFEIGAYSNLKGQMEVHYTPEQAVKAHQAVKGKLIVPSGWGTFDLGLFPWHEPIERFLIAASQSGIEYQTPEIGEIVNLGQVGDSEAWWEPFINK
ncbi:MAG: MBL fold metallo-hydrolase [Candidatus Thiodiazotropha sp. (ex Epidulcina cf. delphinae)]|nr:MBL fold metallo-hydrolase [Candidatus Thiodiazotropha sp. (ex Epidulcina cf. delphinae)]